MAMPGLQCAVAMPVTSSHSVPWNHDLVLMEPAVQVIYFLFVLLL